MQLSQLRLKRHLAHHSYRTRSCLPLPPYKRETSAAAKRRNDVPFTDISCSGIEYSSEENSPGPR